MQVSLYFSLAVAFEGLIFPHRNSAEAAKGETARYGKHVLRLLAIYMWYISAKLSYSIITKRRSTIEPNLRNNFPAHPYSTTFAIFRYGTAVESSER